jgi:predicted nucleotidyltransferase
MSLSSALFTERKSRLFKWLFGMPDRAYHLNELLRLTQLGSASLQQELKQLTEAGVIKSERVGNLRRFSANKHSPVFDELVALTRKTVAVRWPIAQALLPLKDQLSGAWVYGSIAQELDTASSDIDVMLVGQQLRLAKVLEQLTPLEKELGRKINPTCYSEKEFEERRKDASSFVSKVFQKPVLDLLEDERVDTSA